MACIKLKNKYSLYSLNILSDLTSERCPSPRLYSRAHTLRLQQR